MSFEPQALVYTVKKLNLSAASVEAVLKLILEDNCTIPFIARYRKEKTHGLDEVQIRAIQQCYEEHIELEKRRIFILQTIEKMDAMTPALGQQIRSAKSLNELEDLYAPYKSKKKTKAMLAREWGLAEIAEKVLEDDSVVAEQFESQIHSAIKKSNGKLASADEAWSSVSDIWIELFSHDVELKNEFRQHYWSSGIIESSKRKDAHTIEGYHKYEDFFEFVEPVHKIKEPKSSHRFLALRRGMLQKVLKVEIKIDSDMAIQKIASKFFPKIVARGEDHCMFYQQLFKSAKRAFDNVISVSLDLEIKNELKKIADGQAIDVFGVNLKNLLLQPYLGSKAVLGIDPGVRTGCKIVIIDETGKFCGDHIIYPFAPRHDVSGSAEVINKVIEAFKIEYICVGNGTYGRETLEFLEQNIKAVKSGQTKATMISESGASIYSASDVARDEFPDKDVTVRGAISIARRFQDPLAELVKIDPKSIGVGQYQHDVNQVQLKKSLEAVVESCVNYVGVDVNTASAPLLSFVSGIGPALAKNIVKYRESKGVFKSRQQLLSVTRFNDKVFQQAAGFLRIYQSDHPLDATFIHPESYQVLEKWVKIRGKGLKDLVEDGELQHQLKNDNGLKSDLGEFTLNDILKCLQAPSQDPRTVFKNIEFSRDIRSIDDLEQGQWYEGQVTNITMFGAFVDIGIKENGLLHISQMADTFIKDPNEILKVGMPLRVRVLEVDKRRNRIALSCKKTLSGTEGTNKTQKQHSPALKKRPQSHGQSDQGPLKNNPFAQLANMKVKS